MKSFEIHKCGTNEDYWIKYMRYKYWTSYIYGTNEGHLTTYEILMNSIRLHICGTNEDYLTRYMRRQSRVINNIYDLLMKCIGLHI